MNGAVSFFGSFDASGWYGFFLALGVSIFGDNFAPVALVIVTILFLGILTGTVRFIRKRRQR